MLPDKQESGDAEKTEAEIAKHASDEKCQFKSGYLG